MRTQLLAAAALVAFPALAAAQLATPATVAPGAVGAAPPTTSARPGASDAAPAAKRAGDDGALSADMAITLRRAGFSDLQIMPNSVFVRGKDKAGNPVAMVLNPHSMTEVVTLDPHAGTAAGGNGGAAPLTGSGTFATILPSEKLASSLIGLPVANATGAQIGTIKDIAIDHGGVHAYIIGVGGLFGIGDRHIAVTPGALALTYDKTTKKYRASMNATGDQLKEAPEFKFEDLTEAKRD